MHRCLGRTKLLIAILVVRVLAAPIAIRPDTPKVATSYRFVVHVCTWPAQRPQRLATASILLPSFRGSGRGAEVESVLGPPGQDGARLTRAGLLRQASPCFRDARALGQTDRPRC